MVNRIIILIIALLIPVYFYFLIYFSGIQIVPLTTIENIFLNQLFNFIIIPVILASPWLIFIYIFRNRLANTLTYWADKNSIVPLRWLIFYGINTAIMSVFFIFPIVSPLLSIFSAIVLAWNIMADRESFWNRGRNFLIISSIIVFALILALPTFVAISFYPSYIHLSVWILENWQSLASILYSFSIWIVNSITIGTAIWIFYNLILRRNIKDKFDEANWPIRVLQVLLFILFAYLWIPQLGNMAWLIDYINMISLGLLAILILIKLKLGIAARDMTLIGIIVAGGFLIVDLLYRFSLLALTAAFAFTTFIFIISLIYAFINSSDELEF
jgi:hypothetical protein